MKKRSRKKIRALTSVSDDANAKPDNKIFAYLALREVEKDKQAGLARMSHRTAMFLHMYNVRYVDLNNELTTAILYQGYIDRSKKIVSGLKKEVGLAIKKGTLSQERKREILAEAEYHLQLCERFTRGLELIAKRWSLYA